MPIILYIITFALTAVCVLVQPMGSPMVDIAWFAALFSLIALPLLEVRKFHPRSEKEAGILLEWSTKDFLIAFAVTAALIIPVALCNHWMRTEILGLTFNFDWNNYGNLESPLYYQILVQILAVALPEEFFYRGYLQTAFLQFFQKHIVSKFWAPALAITTASLCFALVHLTTGNIARLLTFFPGILFGLLRHKTGGLVAPILCHAACNLMMITFNVHYFP